MSPPNLRYQIGIVAKVHRGTCATELARASTPRQRELWSKRLEEAEQALKSKHLHLKKKRRRP